jgi:hypothetical protein
MRKIEKELSIILVVCISYLHYHRCIQLEVGTQKLKHGTGSNVILMAIVNTKIIKFIYVVRNFSPLLLSQIKHLMGPTKDERLLHLHHAR